MKPEHQRRLVQVLAEKSGEPRYEVATGFAITQRRILTSFHVLEGAVAVRVRCLDADRQHWIDAAMVWPKDGAPAADAAVLEIDASHEVRQRLGGNALPVLAAVVPDDREPWSSQGILRAATTFDSQGRPVSHAEDMTGTLCPAKNDGIMSLVVDSRPAEEAGWQGASGSPVFVRDRLIGVVRSWPTSWAGNMLQAVWLGALFECPDFAEAVGWLGAGKRLEQLIEEVTTTLSGRQSLSLCVLMAEELKLDVQEASVIARRICELTPVRVLAMANRVLKKLKDKPRPTRSQAELESADVLVSVVDRLLVGMLGPSAAARLEALGQLGSLVPLELPCGAMSVAEVVMAYLDDGTPWWAPESLDTKDPHGATRAPLEPAVGFGENPDDRIRVLLKDLADALEIAETHRGDGSAKALAKAVNPAIRYRADKELNAGLPRRWYALYASDRDQAAAQRLKELVPELRVARLSGPDSMDDEVILCQSLRSYLQLKNQ